MISVLVQTEPKFRHFCTGLNSGFCCSHLQQLLYLLHGCQLVKLSLSWWLNFDWVILRLCLFFVLKLFFEKKFVREEPFTTWSSLASYHSSLSCCGNCSFSCTCYGYRLGLCLPWQKSTPSHMVNFRCSSFFLYFIICDYLDQLLASGIGRLQSCDLHI